MATEPIKIDGLSEFVRALKRLDADLPKTVRVALNQAADVIVGYARPRVPRRTGRAAKSVKAKSTRLEARVVGGSNRVPYYPWLDFGGRVGPGRSVERPFRKHGRYIYQGYIHRKDSFKEILEVSLVNGVRRAGIEVN